MPFGDALYPNQYQKIKKIPTHHLCEHNRSEAIAAKSIDVRKTVSGEIPDASPVTHRKNRTDCVAQLSGQLGRAQAYACKLSRFSTSAMAHI